MQYSVTEVIPGLSTSHCRQHNELTRDLFTPKGITGASNGWLDVQLADGTVALRLWLLDSMDRGCRGARGWHVPLHICSHSEHIVRLRRRLQRLDHVRPCAGAALPRTPSRGSQSKRSSCLRPAAAWPSSTFRW